mmetsp:Transcript_96233/g.281039  ORF Transcript_96233/g.281039 Transcript_96233/m.281039 type:complete len:513 (-) Transcript_96233:64-1602(-)
MEEPRLVLGDVQRWQARACDAHGEDLGELALLAARCGRLLALKAVLFVVPVVLHRDHALEDEPVRHPVPPPVARVPLLQRTVQQRLHLRHDCGIGDWLLVDHAAIARQLLGHGLQVPACRHLHELLVLTLSRLHLLGQGLVAPSPDGRGHGPLDLGHRPTGRGPDQPVTAELCDRLLEAWLDGVVTLAGVVVVGYLQEDLAVVAQKPVEALLSVAGLLVDDVPLQHLGEPDRSSRDNVLQAPDLLGLLQVLERLLRPPVVRVDHLAEALLSIHDRLHELHYVLVAFVLGLIQRRPAPRIRGLQVVLRPMDPQQPHAVDISALAGGHEGGPPSPVRGVQLRPVLDAEPHQLRVALLPGLHGAGPLLLVVPVRRGAGLQQARRHLGVAELGGGHERRPALVVRHVGVRPAREQRLDGRQVAALGGLQQRRPAFVVAGVRVAVLQLALDLPHVAGLRRLVQVAPLPLARLRRPPPHTGGGRVRRSIAWALRGLRPRRCRGGARVLQRVDVGSMRG